MNIRRSALWSVGAVFSITAVFSAAADPPPSPDVLMQADRDFAAATPEDGIDGWMSFFADDSRLLTGVWPGGADGPEQIHQAMAPFLQTEGNRLSWEPRFADISQSGDLGYTIGTYERTTMTDGTAEISSGVYVTIWRQQDDGSWKVVLDAGVPAPAGISSESVP